MKTKIILSVATLCMLLGATVFTSCKKENNTPPAITLLGQNPWTIYFGGAVTDPGATALDNAGNNLTTSIVSSWSETNPNQTWAGTYTISYFVSDAAGNTASATRTVIVKIVPANLIAHWSVTDLVDTTHNFYTDSLYSTLVNPKNIYVTKFADYAGAAIYFNLSDTLGTNVILPQQSISCGTGATLENRSFKGTGTVANDGSTITINYGVVQVGSTDTIRGTETYSNRTGSKKIKK